MVVEKTHGEEWEVGLSVKGQRLAQVKKCTYMEATVEPVDNVEKKQQKE